MNPFSGASWLWRAWRGGSLTFAVLFALGLLGVSVLGAFRQLLSRVGAPWYILLLAPFVVVALVAKREQRWMPDADQRRRWSRRILFGSIAGAVLITWLGPKRRPVPAPTPAPAWNDVHR